MKPRIRPAYRGNHFLGFQLEVWNAFSAEYQAVGEPKLLYKHAHWTYLSAQRCVAELRS